MNSIAWPFPDAFLEKIYALPQPMRTIDDWRRLHGQDLQYLDDLALQRERRCVERRLDYEQDVLRRAWLMQRLAAVEAERRRRVDQLSAELRRSRGSR